MYSEGAGVDVMEIKTLCWKFRCRVRFALFQFDFKTERTGERESVGVRVISSLY